jgi:uncharacterized protein (DUF1330 family)
VDVAFDRAVPLYRDDGKSLRQVARELGCSYDRVRKELKARNVRLRSQGGDHGGRKNFRGGEYVDRHGYVWVRITEVPEEHLHVMAHNGYIAKHRLMMARYLGRALVKGEQVHHKDGKKRNNLIGNLQLRFKAHGSGAAFRCIDCGSCNIESVELA